MDILIVEDDKKTVSDLKLVLNKLGHHVIAVTSNGKEAIQKTKDLKPDIVLINIKLNGPMTGIEAAKKIIKLTPVIFLTVFIKNCLNKSLQLPEDAIVLNMPIKEDHLEYCISRAIGD